MDRLRGADQQWITVTGYGDDEEESSLLLVEYGMLKDFLRNTITIRQKVYLKTIDYITPFYQL